MELNIGPLSNIIIDWLSERGTIPSTAEVGIHPMARREQHLLGASMKTPQTISGKPLRTGFQQIQPEPQPEPVTWHKAVPPRIEGRRDDGERDPTLATDEWRPGEAAKRGAGGRCSGAPVFR